MVGYSHGNVNPACDSMTPSHGVAPQHSIPPYRLVANPNPDLSIKVTLEAQNRTQFKGFLLEARKYQTPDIRVGSFADIPNDARLLQCGEGGEAVSHKYAIPRRKIHVTWYPPKGENVVIFRATVVMSYETFWTGLSTPSFHVLSGTGKKRT